MNLSQRLRTCAKHTSLDAVIELLNEAADEIDRLCASAALPTLRPGDSHMESLIEAAIQGHASTRDAMRWLVRQVMKPAQLPATPKPVAWLDEMLADTREVFDAGGSETPQVVRDVIEYVKSWVTVYSEKNHPAPATHPAPSVPGDVVRDAERWCAVERASCDVTLRLHNTRSGLRSAVIDAAIAAKDASA